MPAMPIGQSMIEAKLIDSKQLEELLERQRNLPERVPLGRLSVELGLVSEEQFAPFIAAYFNMPYVDLTEGRKAQKEALDAIPASIAKRLNVLPIRKDDNTITVALSDPLDLTTLENLKVISGYNIRPVVSSPRKIKRSIWTNYYGLLLMDIEEAVEEGVVEPQQGGALGIASERIYRLKGPAPGFLIRQLVEYAVANKITYAHIQPEKNRVSIFFRVQDKLEKAGSFPKGILLILSDFIRMAANVGPLLKDAPQSGHFNFTSQDLSIQVGFSIVPTFLGDRIVLEIPYHGENSNWEFRR